MECHLHRIANGKASCLLQVIGNNEVETTCSSNDGTVHREPVEATLDPMPVPPWPKAGSGEPPASGGVEGNLDRSLLVSLQEDGRKSLSLHSCTSLTCHSPDSWKPQADADPSAKVRLFR